MIEAVQDVYYRVSDAKRAVTFYRDVLGLCLVYEGEDWCSFDIGGVRLGLDSNEGAPVPPVPKGRYGALAGGTLTLRVADIRAAVAELRARGVRFLGEVVDADWGSVVAFEDPDGNVLKLMQPPRK